MFIKIHDDFKSISKALTDIILLTKLSLYGSLTYYDRLKNIRIQDLINQLKNNKPIYIRVRTKDFEAHILSYLGYVIGVSAKVKGKWIVGTSILGSIEGSEGIVYAYEISTNLLPKNLRDAILKVEHEIKSSLPPTTWFNKEIYGFKIIKSLNFKTPIFYVLLGNYEGRNYVIKVLRERALDGKPLALSKTSEHIHNFLRLILTHLNVLRIPLKDFVLLAKKKGISEKRAKEIFKYGNNFEHIYGFIIPKHIYSNIAEYVKNPPIAVAEFINGEPLSKALEKIKGKGLLFPKEILIEIAGSLSFIHILGYVHGNINLENVIVKENEKSFNIKLTNSLFIPEEGSYFITNLDYVDPYVIMNKGIYRLSSDVYSFGLLTYHLLSGKPLLTRVLLNYALAEKINKNLVVSNHVKEQLKIPKDLRKYFSEIKEVVTKLSFKNLSRDMEILNDVVQSLEEKMLRDEMISNYKNLISKCLALIISKRYENAIGLFNDLLSF